MRPSFLGRIKPQPILPMGLLRYGSREAPEVLAVIYQAIRSNSIAGLPEFLNHHGNIRRR